MSLPRHSSPSPAAGSTLELAVVAGGRGSILGGVVGLLAVAAVYGVTIAPGVEALARGVTLFGFGTAVYQRAQWASTAALAALVAGAIALAWWLVAWSLRGALGLPRPRSTAARRRLTGARVAIAVPLLIWVALWSIDEYYLRRVVNVHYKTGALGVLVCLLFAYDVPRLLRRGLSLLRSSAPFRGARRFELDQLPDGGLVRTRGRIVAAGSSRSAAEPAWVYRRSLVPDASAVGSSPTGVVLHQDGSGTTCAEVRPFLIERHGVRVWIEVDARQLIVNAPVSAQRNSESATLVAELLVGDEVEVVGRVEAHVGGAYRQSGARQLLPGPTGVIVQKGSRSLTARLVSAAIVELLAAASLALTTVGFVAMWIWIGTFANKV